MLCRRCPHHVRHGQVSPDNKLTFKDMCGLKMRTAEPVTCAHYPFPKVFDYMHCEVYMETFKTNGQRNDVVPTKDFQYSDALTSNSITDMELL
jgi:hypothetical protein